MKRFGIFKNPVVFTGTVTVLLLLVVGQVITLSQLKKQQTSQGSAQVVQWHVAQSATTSCNVNGQAVISTTFTNEETTNDIDVVAKDNQSGATVDLGTVKAGSTVNGQISPKVSSLSVGSVLFVLTWTNGQTGQDSRTAQYSAIQCTTPTATPTPTGTPVPTATPTPSPTPACTGVNCPAPKTILQFTLSNQNLNPNSCSYSPEAGYICKEKLKLNQITTAALNSNTIDWVTNLEGNVSGASVSPDHGSTAINGSESVIVTVPVTGSCTTTPDATESITFFDRDNPTDNAVAVFTCGKQVTPDKGILITTDQTNYQPKDSVSVIVSNTLSVPIYATDLKAGCSILSLQSLVNGHWTANAQANCTVGRAKVVTKIDPGQNYTALVKANAYQGFLSDVYRFELKYATNPTDAVANPLTKDSAPFTVDGVQCMPHPICLDSVASCMLPAPKTEWCSLPTPLPTSVLTMIPTAGPTAVVPTLYCLGNCPGNTPTTTPIPTATQTITGTPTVTPSTTQAVSPSATASPTVIASIIPTGSPCTVTQSVTSTTTHWHKKKNDDKQDDALIGKLLKIIKNLLGGNNNPTPTPTPTPIVSGAPTPTVNPCEPSVAPSTEPTVLPTTTISEGPTPAPCGTTQSVTSVQQTVQHHKTKGHNNNHKKNNNDYSGLLQQLIDLIMQLLGDLINTPAPEPTPTPAPTTVPCPTNVTPTAQISLSLSITPASGSGGGSTPTTAPSVAPTTAVSSSPTTPVVSTTPTPTPNNNFLQQLLHLIIGFFLQLIGLITGLFK